VAWKPAFGGALVAAITATSPVQMVTVRAGMLPLLEPREGEATVEHRPLERRGRVVVHDRLRDDDIDVLPAADVVIGVGHAIPPQQYVLLEPLAHVLGAEMGCTRKVTDEGWMPRARQIGITGRSIQPRLFVSLAAAGKFNHVVGVRGALNVLAVNNDPDALIFSACDVGLVAPWEDAVPALVAALGEHRA
jgi:electron transfer flavoprotein alpha subunit